MKYLLLFLILTTIIISCKKESRKYSVNGRITDKYSNLSYNLNIPICATNHFYGSDPVAETTTDLSGHYQLNFEDERDFSGYHVFANNYYSLYFNESYPYGLSIPIQLGNNIVDIQGTCVVDVAIMFVRDSSDIIDSIYLKSISPVDTMEECLNIYDDVNFNGYSKTIHIYATNKNYVFAYYLKNGIHCVVADTIIPACVNEIQTDTIKL